MRVENLHTTTQMQSGLRLEVVVGEGTAVHNVLAGGQDPTLVRQKTFCVLDVGVDVLHGVVGQEEYPPYRGSWP